MSSFFLIKAVDYEYRDRLSLLDGEDPDGVGGAGALPPAGDADHRVAGLEEAARLAEVHAELDAVVDVLDPVLDPRL